MAEKSDDIKQLFSHLGLNPSDYREIRSAPSANATVSEAPRRWSLLQSVPRAANAPIAAVRVSAPAMQVASQPSVLPSALLAALPQAPIRSVLPAAATVARPVPAVAAFAPAVMPAAVPPPARPSARDELVSIFQSVGTVRVPTAPVDELPSIRLTEWQRQSEKVPVPAPVRAAERSMDLSNHLQAVSARASAMASAMDAPMTRAAPARASQPQAAAVASGRLKLKLGGRSSPQQEQGECLQDVFRRLAGDNHA